MVRPFDKILIVLTAPIFLAAESISLKNGMTSCL